jgi:hypothetical protein
MALLSVWRLSHRFRIRFLLVPRILKVERAFKAHLSGRFESPPQFSHENYWKALQVFFGKVDAVSERRWNHILARALANVDAEGQLEECDVQADQSMVSLYRDEIYVPSSPEKA